MYTHSTIVVVRSDNECGVAVFIGGQQMEDAFDGTDAGLDVTCLHHPVTSVINTEIH